MTSKTDIINAVATTTGKTQAAVREIVEATFNEVIVQLKQGSDVNLSGFGIFQRTERDARQGRNPATGETIQIAASTGVKFKAAKALKEAL